MADLLQKNNLFILDKVLELNLSVKVALPIHYLNKTNTHKLNKAFQEHSQINHSKVQ